MALEAGNTGARFLTILSRPLALIQIPTLFPSYIQPGAVLGPNRILVGSRSNFGAPLATGAGAEGSLLSIDPSGMSLNGIAISTDGQTIYLTFVGPGKQQGGVLAVPAF